MEKDSFRKKLDVKMFCSKHPRTELGFSTDSKIGASSAYEINVKILIHPCETCENEMTSLKDAVKTIISIND